MNIIEVTTPGRELDALVAEKITGLIDIAIRATSCDSTDLTHAFDGKYHLVPHYSTDIATAWEVVDKVLSMPHTEFHLDYDGEWNAQFRIDVTDRQYTDCYSYSKSAPHAICLAAIKAVEAIT